MNTLNEFELNRIRKFYNTNNRHYDDDGDDRRADRRQQQKLFRSKSSRLRQPRQQQLQSIANNCDYNNGNLANNTYRYRQAKSAERLADNNQQFEIDLNRYQRAFLGKDQLSRRRLRSDKVSFGRALFDFQAANSRELSLKRNDLLEILKFLDHQWALVEDCQSGLQGLVPLSYIDHNVGCAVAKRDVSNKQRVFVNSQGCCLIPSQPIGGSCEPTAELAPGANSVALLQMSKGEPITLIKRLSGGHWYEASNTRQATGLVWSNDLDIIKQPVLSSNLASERQPRQQQPRPQQQRDDCSRLLGRQQQINSDAKNNQDLDDFSDDNELAAEYNYIGQAGDEQILILESGERVLAKRRPRSASGGCPQRCCYQAGAKVPQTKQFAPTTSSVNITCNRADDDDDDSNRQLPRRSSSSPYLAAPSEHRKLAQQADLPRLCRAKFAYKPKQRDELELVVGDILVVIHECDDGWFIGSSYSSKETGTFPGNFVEPI